MFILLRLSLLTIARYHRRGEVDDWNPLKRTKLAKMTRDATQVQCSKNIQTYTSGHRRVPVPIFEKALKYKTAAKRSREHVRKASKNRATKSRLRKSVYLLLICPGGHTRQTNSPRNMTPPLVMNGYVSGGAGPSGTCHPCKYIHSFPRIRLFGITGGNFSNKFQNFAFS